ncbi:MAG: hypothetical protein IH623_02965 [Verrucomicrobia bacterium]|nr:hypothetical protein [Verrucomicrobiota bacterium]
MNTYFARFAVCLLLLVQGVVATVPAATQAEVKNLSLSGGLDDGRAKLIIEADLQGLDAARAKPIYATALQHSLRATLEKFSHTFLLKIDVIQGEPKEIALVLSGEGELRSVTGDRLLDWSLREEAGGSRFLVLRLQPAETPLTNCLVTVTAETEFKDLPHTVTPLTLASPLPGLFQGFVRVDTDAALSIAVASPVGAVPVEWKYLPESMRQASVTAGSEPLAFRIHDASYALPMTLSLADPELRRVVLSNARLTGRLSDQSATFTLTATAKVKNPQGGSLPLLSGGVALTDLDAHPGWRMKLEDGQFVLACDQPGEFPIKLQFHATVRQADGWNSVDFQVAPSALQPIVLQGLPADTQFQFANAARPERSGNDFLSHLPADGAVKLAWKETRKEQEGRLFYAAEMLSQITVSPGLMRQVALLGGKVMQGEMIRVTLLLRGDGEVTRVIGDQVLAWTVEPGNVERFPGERRLVIQFNQPQKDQFAVQVQTQTPLGAFPQSANALQLRPEGATRFAGYFRIVNDGAVRLEVVQAGGLSQISPEQFPETDATKAAFRMTGSQRFAYRFSGAEFALRIQADQILPELAVSQVLAYHLGENELAIDAELELDIREAPLRELLLRVPKGYALARLIASGMSDYFLTEIPLTRPSDTLSPSDGERDGVRGTTDQSELRIVYGQPVSGRQVVQLRLERNKPLGETNWALPKLEVSKAKSTRGHVGVSADAGFRLTPERTQALTEIATAFFPRKVAGIQSAFRLSDPAWQATMRVERLPQTVQADAFHLFSIGEGIAYGSSVLNFLISGAPVSAFRIELSEEYFNVEFTGKDVRNWEKTTNGFLVKLHTPVAGAYTLLATYERPFKAQGDTLAFTGARPLDAQSEQGHTLVISAYQFRVEPVDVSPGLLPLETGEVPPDYRLFFDAPILKAYRYTARPFNLRLALSPLAQGETLSQVVDRASLTTRISKEGQVVTDVRYFVKNRGNPHFRLTLPDGTQLWSAQVNGAAVVPVTDAKTNLIPLPQQTDPNAVLTLDLKLASTSSVPARVSVAAPMPGAPVMLAEWKLEPDAGRRLVFRKGSLTPVHGVTDISGFAQLARTFRGQQADLAIVSLLAALILFGVAGGIWRLAVGEGVYKFSARYLTCALVGLVAFLVAMMALASLGDLTQRQTRLLPRAITFLAPVQQAGSPLTVEVANIAEGVSFTEKAGFAWPALLALAVWVYGWLRPERETKVAAWLLGWLLLVWAALRWPNGAVLFLWVVVAFLLLHVAFPLLRRLCRLPRKPQSGPPTVSPGDIASATAAFALLATLQVGFAAERPGQNSNLPSFRETALAASVTQQIRVEEQFALATAKLRWQATKGQMLPLLFEPAVLTQITYPTNSLKLVQATAGDRTARQLLALESGVFEVEAQYQLQLTRREGESGFPLPTQSGLVNRLTLTLVNLDVDVRSTAAVSVQREMAGSNTVATLVLAPVRDAWIGWQPRSRDVKREKPVFYVEWTQLYVPSAGVIEGAHYAAIRPAQGELGELVFNVPPGATVTDVIDSSRRREEADSAKPKTDDRLLTSAATGIVSLWRFDPDTRKLRVTLNPSQSRPFTLIIRSQVATGPLSFEQSIGLVSVENAANQIGLLGVATGNEVQLDTVDAAALSPINLEDFPGSVAQALAAQIPGLTVRRAFRYADTKATASVKASPVEPDVRVETQDTLSLGEDRIVLAANVIVDITRAGVFRLSFDLPPNLEVESISGAALSHWTELKTEAERIITLHLKGKTEGRQQFAISLTGPGVRATGDWTVPRLVLREANKHSGTLVVVPEQGLLPQVAASEGLTQLDPQKSGIRQKGVLAFRVLQKAWQLSLKLEQVEPWIQVTSLQHATVTEAQVKVAANLQYQIENTGLKAFRLWLPVNAESVRVQGDQVADYLATPGAVTNGLQEWEVKLHRRVIGRYLLQVFWQTQLTADVPQILLRGVQAADVNLQRGFVTVQAGGRLQVRPDILPESLQPTEWQSIPRALQQDLPAATANFAWRLVEPDFQLPLNLDRHKAAKLLPARVNNVTLNSVISDSGAMLTQVRLEMLPGDKRLLQFTLPKDAKFWFAFVNQSGVWPWREQDRVLIPLEQESRSGKTVPVELFYSSQAGQPGGRSLDLELLAPKFDLPLENVTWRIHLNEKWHVKRHTGTLQFQEAQLVTRAAAMDVQTYLQNEVSQQREKTRTAEEMLSAANTALERGDPQQARRAFQAAFGLSQHDLAFNEDARVQLNNLKLQQALVGLNFRQAAVAGEEGGVAGQLRELRSRKDANYTQRDAKEIIDRNTAEENAAFMRLAEKLIQQQDAAVSSPAAIRANIPEQGRLLTFQRAVVVDPWADLRIGLQAKVSRASSWGMRIFVLLVTALIMVGAARLARGVKRQTG